jgi:N-hydroxyarylamine O-acetyltransferase
MDVDRYRRRIEDDGPTAPSVGTLTRLHRAHLHRVPFENLDIPLGRPIVLEPDALFEKVVDRRRGGFCYELNGLFARLLQALGFAPILLAARVYGDGQPGPGFDHMLLLLDLDGPWIADVGFGDSFVDPLPLGPGVQRQAFADYRLRETPAGWVLDQRRRGADWAPQYVFTLTSHPLRAFEPMCAYQQTSPRSSFTRRSICSRATRRGRVTFANDRLIVTADGEREERPVSGPAELRALLREHFDLELDADAPVERLLRPAVRPPP